MPEEKNCSTCLNFWFEGLDKICKKNHTLIGEDYFKPFTQWHVNCPDWVSRTEKTLCGN